MGLMIGAILLGGLAVGLLIWGGRGWIVGRFFRDVAWVRETSLRFNPDPIDAVKRTVGLYVLFGVVLVGLVTLSPSPFFGGLFWLVLLLVPRILVEVLWKSRKAKIDGQLAGAIAAMCNSIRAGLTLVQAIERLGEQAPEPIRTEFKVMANHYAFGADVGVIIKTAKARLELANFNLFASALLLNREMGGDVADTLERISQSLDRLRQMRKTVEAHTSEGRMNIKVLLIAPVIMLLMLSTVDPEGVKALFTTPQGYGVLLVAGTLTGTGVYFAMRIMRSEV